ncbi:hypothetical protein AVDCRST_MAG81-450 [uncultured Synechococcales cyanobacterium]|uniref:Uncharacterized protein n=1 Tax=uncultured Synechococcales cyanobacterium TaxID=1936017 RepID=A0A6J4UUB5_9CYAN|nr:hypothetical protein AVDCRST_MAG81-450 [uncultured Synechococcales cyanobacterium]
MIVKSERCKRSWRQRDTLAQTIAGLWTKAIVAVPTLPESLIFATKPDSMSSSDG